MADFFAMILGNAEETHHRSLPPSRLANDRLFHVSILVI